jgi:sugar lactone lactonase YvrE
LDPQKGQLPEGLVVDSTGEHALVGLAPTGEILSIDLRSGATTHFGNVPALPPNKAFLLGLALDKAGNLLAGVASSTPDYQPGIYKLPPTGGAGTLFASNEGLVFPNGLSVEEDGSLLVTDSLMGSIFKITSTGAAELWLKDPLLAGDMSAPCANGAGFPIGANGIVVSKGSVFVLNTDHGSIVKVPLEKDGAAGMASTFVAPNCSTLGGADGLALDADGALLVAANQINAITRVDVAGSVTVLVEDHGLDFPASLAVIGGGADRQVLITNAALKSARTPGGVPHPGLLRLSPIP